MFWFWMTWERKDLNLHLTWADLNRFASHVILSSAMHQVGSLPSCQLMARVPFINFQLAVMTSYAFKKKVFVVHHWPIIGPQEDVEAWPNHISPNSTWFCITSVVAFTPQVNYSKICRRNFIVLCDLSESGQYDFLESCWSSGQMSERRDEKRCQGCQERSVWCPSGWKKSRDSPADGELGQKNMEKDYAWLNSCCIIHVDTFCRIWKKKIGQATPAKSCKPTGRMGNLISRAPSHTRRPSCQQIPLQVGRRKTKRRSSRHQWHLAVSARAAGPVVPTVKRTGDGSKN